MQKNATKWPQMIEAIYDSFGTGDHSGDGLTRGIMDKIVSWLVKGKKLSPKLRKTLLLNIEQRTSYIVTEAPDDIRLTPNQIKHIRRTKPEWVALANGDDGSDLDEVELNGAPVSTTFHPNGEDLSTLFQRSVNALSTSIQRSFNDLSSIQPEVALALALDLVARAQETATLAATSSQPSTSKEKKMEDERSNHDGSMIAASPPIAHDEAQPAQVVHKDSPMPLDEDEVLGHRATSAGRAVVSYFHNDENKRPSANLELGPDRYALVFSDADFAEGQLHDVCSAQWLENLEAAGIGQIRAQSRAAGTGKVRHCMSPLYDAKDTYARKGPAVKDAVAVLLWNDDEQPHQVTIIANNATTIVPLTKFYGKSAKSPTHKGTGTIAA